MFTQNLFVYLLFKTKNMIKITNQNLIDFCKNHNTGIKNDLFFEPKSKFFYEIKYYTPSQGEIGTFYYIPIRKYSFNKTFALNLNTK